MNKLKCYFCNRILGNETAEQHSAHCGYVLEPCPNKCGAYIPRKTRSRHLQICSNSRLKSVKSSDNLCNATSYDPMYYSGSNSEYGSLPHSSKRSSGLIKESTTASYNHDYPSDQPINKLEHNHQQHGDIIHQLEAAIKKLHEDMQYTKAESNKVQYQLEGTKAEFRKMVASNKNDVNHYRLLELAKDLCQLKNAVSSQQLPLTNLQVDVRQVQNDMDLKFTNYDHFFRQELQKLNMAQANQLLQMETLKTLNSELREEVKRLKDDFESLKSRYSNAEEEKKVYNFQTEIATQPGKLLWKINEFTQKLEKAKSNEKMHIKSPIFYTTEYGYKLRLVVYLNGLKKWRGRHLLACLHVLKSDFDDLLKWPCRIEANIILKDLENIEKPKDFVRYITAKRNYPEDIADDPQESSTQYIFIPHTTLLKPNHLKNDSIFLEILVNNSQ